MLEEAPLLFTSHREEIDLFDLPLDYNAEFYRDAEASGALKVYSVREDNYLIGYCVFVLFKHPHHKTSLHAKQDILYIQKHKRGRGISFLKYCEQRLKEAGVEYIHQCVPAQNDWSKLLTRMGYDKLETIYTRRL